MLLGGVAPAPGTHLKGRFYLYIPVPIRHLPVSGDYQALPGFRVVPDDLKNGFVDPVAFPSIVGEKEKPRTKETAQANSVEVDGVFVENQL